MQKNTVMLVEDNPDDAELLVRAFAKVRPSGRIVIATDGADALDRLLGGAPGNAGLPVLLILDLKLPKISGTEVLRRLRADPRTRLLPVVILTSSKEERDLVDCYSLGANSYIQKPVDFSRFTDVVRQIGEYWLVLNERVPHG